MKVGVPKETFPGERRVALVPSVMAQLTKAGIEVLVETGAGEAARADVADAGSLGLLQHDAPDAIAVVAHGELTRVLAATARTFFETPASITPFCRRSRFNVPGPGCLTTRRAAQRGARRRCRPEPARRRAGATSGEARPRLPG